MHEQDAAPGLANRMGVRLGARPAVSLPGHAASGRDAHREPGARASFASVDRRAARRSARSWPSSAARRGHARSTGPRSAATTVGGRASTSRFVTCAARATSTSATPSSGGDRKPGDVLEYDLVAYEEHMDDLYGRAALAVCRAGAGTIAELTVVGPAAVLVPLPGAPSDHQTRNAQTLEQAGAAVMVRDADLSADAPRRRRLGVARGTRAAGRDADGRARTRPARRRGATRRSRRGARPCLTPLDLTTPRRVHIVGVAGAGMSAIALVLARMGHRVSGSDIKATAVLERLAAAGVDVHVGNRAEFVPADADAVVYSTAVPLTNVELATATERGIPVLHRSGALAALTATRKTIAVAGSHGKTTTASMLALILRSAGWDPSFVIGGEVNEVGTNAAFGEGEWLVLEADESDGTFLHLSTSAALVTNIEPDHLDFYGGFDALVGAFERFVDAVDGPVVTCADDEVAARIASSRPHVRTYGVHPDADYRIVDTEVGPPRLPLRTRARRHPRPISRSRPA